AVEVDRSAVEQQVTAGAARKVGRDGPGTAVDLERGAGERERAAVRAAAVEAQRSGRDLDGAVAAQDRLEEGSAWGDGALQEPRRVLLEELAASVEARVVLDVRQAGAGPGTARHEREIAGRVDRRRPGVRERTANRDATAHDAVGAGG